ncbi:MAG: Formamidopyrimidine-DNA glycosylase [Planctomycetota bacterium]
MLRERLPTPEPPMVAVGLPARGRPQTATRPTLAGMPELPEVETMCRGLAGIVGRRIGRVEFPRGPVRPLLVRPARPTISRWLAGAEIAAVSRRGKRVVLELTAAACRSGSDAGRRWLVIEPRMTGLMLVVEPPSASHVRMVIKLEGASKPRQFLFWDRRGLGTISLLDQAGFDAACGPVKLGPDGLLITGDDLAARLGRSQRAVKAALLDQRAVAGIGNIYACEILFRAGIDPRARCRRLGRDAWERIAREARRVLAEAVRLEGSSIGDETYRTADSRPGRAQQRHRVYGREGEPCRSCGIAIERIVLAQRATFFCRGCQVRI